MTTKKNLDRTVSDYIAGWDTAFSPAVGGSKGTTAATATKAPAAKKSRPRKPKKGTTT